MFAMTGTISFLLFVLGDINDAFWHRRFLKPAFLIGAILLVVSTAGSILKDAPETIGMGNIAFLAAALLFAVLLIWALFFSFPPKPAYVEASKQRTACTGGMYALCRHPGILWFCFLYGCLIPGVGFPWELSLLYCVLNILLGWVEDRWIFPRVFHNYFDYKQHTPFLIPTAKSLRAWIHSIGQQP